MISVGCRYAMGMEPGRRRSGVRLPDREDHPPVSDPPPDEKPVKEPPRNPERPRKPVREPPGRR